METREEVKGQIRRVTKDRKVYYTDDTGMLCERVTKVLQLLDKPALMYWAMKVSLEHIKQRLLKLKGKPDEAYLDMMIKEAKGSPYKQKTKAANIGTTVHKLIESHIKGEKIDISIHDEKVQNGFKAFLLWEKEEKVKYIETEKMVLWKHIGRGFGGQIDNVYEKNEKRILHDWKTSSGIYEPEVPLQLGAYKLAYEFTTGEHIDGATVGRLDKLTGELEIKEYDSGTLYDYGKAFVNLFTYNELIKGLITK